MTSEQRLEEIVRTGPTLMRVLTFARDLDLPDWLIFSGAVYQRVLNHLTGRDLDYGIKDYDLVYFDASDISYEAEDAAIRRAAAAFEPPLRDLVEVRNQARVHLWFEAKFGEPYGPLSGTAEAITRFVTPLNAVGVRLERDDDRDGDEAIVNETIGNRASEQIASFGKQIGEFGLLPAAASRVELIRFVEQLDRTRELRVANLRSG